MRVIKFRGKREDNGKWVHGSLFKEEYSNACNIMGFDYFNSAEGLQREPFDYIVLPESVGQFCGLHDKNGVEIYSGDVYDIGICTKVIRPGHFIEDTYELMKLIEDGAVIEVIGNIHSTPDLLK